MPRTLTVTLSVPTYEEVRREVFATSHQSSILGVNLIAAYQQDAANRSDISRLTRRELLFAARAKFSLARHLLKTRTTPHRGDRHIAALHPRPEAQP